MRYLCATHNTVSERCYLIALVDIVVNQLKQKPHGIPQDEGGDQVPVDDVSKASYAPVPQVKSSSSSSSSFHGGSTSYKLRLWVW